MCRSNGKRVSGSEFGAAAVTLVGPEDDSDLHVVIEDGKGRTMITEAPLPACPPRATALRRKQMGVAHAAVRVCAGGVVTEVAFFDFQPRTDRSRAERDRAAPDPRLPLRRVAPSLTSSSGYRRIAATPEGV